VICRAVGG